MSRVCTRLNFFRNTEEAFNFQKSIFGEEFGGRGIACLGNIPSQSGMQPLSENDKNLIMHIELAILGSYLLMGTDAPESMGYKLNFGNKVHINPEHDAKAERKKLFNAFSVSVKVTMPL